MMKYLVSVGLEIHVALKTEFKAFSPEGVNESSWVSLGFPGVLPALNKEAVAQTLRLASALNCRVNYKNIVFDRKNYFYYDLPKGYQITQHFYPMGTGGYLELSSQKKIAIKQIHMEEDTAQQIKNGHSIRLLFGRLGRAISEVVTEPHLSSYLEVEEFLKKLRRICIFSGSSNASYEDGEMRVDLNISLRRNEDDPLSKKAEVKNLNSLNAIKKSLNWIIEEQTKALDEGRQWDTYTYFWSEKSERCEIMRKKGDSNEYFYIPESNIPKLSLSDQEYEEVIRSSGRSVDEVEEELRKEGFKDSEVNHMLDDPKFFHYVQRLDEKLKNIRSSYNWMANVISGFLENFNDFPYEEVEKVVIDVEETKKLNLKLAKLILKEILKNGLSYKEAFKFLKISPVVKDDLLRGLVEEAFRKYESQIPKLIQNPLKLERMIIGECMKQSNGQADPTKTKAQFDELLKVYLDKQIESND